MNQYQVLSLDGVTFSAVYHTDLPLSNQDYISRISRINRRCLEAAPTQAMRVCLPLAWVIFAVTVSIFVRIIDVRDFTASPGLGLVISGAVAGVCLLILILTYLAMMRAVNIRWKALVNDLNAIMRENSDMDQGRQIRWSLQLNKKWSPWTDTMLVQFRWRGLKESRLILDFPQPTQQQISLQNAQNAQFNTGPVYVGPGAVAMGYNAAHAVQVYPCS